MSISDKLEVRVRLLPEQFDRCEKVAHSRGQTKTAFAAAAIMAEVMAGEEELRLRKRAPRIRADTPAPAEGSTPPSSSFNLSKKAETAVEQTAAPPTAPPPVVVNVGTSNGSASVGSAPDISWLADFVIDGPAYMRDMRMRTAVEMIRARCKTDQERTDAANKLDAELAKREPKTENTFGRSARVAFDKLKTFIK